MRLAFTCNGPGETAGWLTPLLHSLYAQSPQADVHVFYVPDDYASGREPALVRVMFPQARVYDPKTYVRVALGARLDEVPEGFDAVVYLGGDLMHAARLHKRFGGSLACYKFCRPKYAASTARAFAVDDRNEAELEAWGVPHERVTRVGNLVIDGALAQVADGEAAAPESDVLFMPGSRGYEVEHLIPFFFTAALAMHREQPALRIAFGISPFTPLDAVRDALERGGDPRVFARTGTLIEDAAGVSLSTPDGSIRFPVLRNAIAAAAKTRLAITIPGTKVIELAVVGTPVISCSLLNAPELVTINGPLTYLDRIPLFGSAIKRRVVTAYARRFEYHTQPNIDAHTDLVLELHSTLTPGRVARIALDRLADEDWLQSRSQALGRLYREHVGASVRMASGILALRQTG